jgi:hypothetical protein
VFETNEYIVRAKMDEIDRERRTRQVVEARRRPDRLPALALIEAYARWETHARRPRAIARRLEPALE